MGASEPDDVIEIESANLNAAYSTAKSGVGICSTGVTRLDMVNRSTIAVVMAGLLGEFFDAECTGPLIFCTAVHSRSAS